MRQGVLKKIHDGHQGIVKCRERAQQSAWWPRIAANIKQIVSMCSECLETKPSQRREPLLPSQPPERPFQRVAMDICEYQGSHYLVSCDYYSRYIDISYLPRLTSQVVIGKTKSCFAQHGIPETLVTDNGPQFTSREFQKFATDWNFAHVTSSPHFPQSNGQAESAVKIAKGILRQGDPFLALLTYRSTPLPSLGASPAELAFGRKLRTTLPSLPQTLAPRVIDPETVRARDLASKSKQKLAYDRHHGAQPLSELSRGQPVFIKVDEEKGWKLPGEVLSKCAPRSYLVDTPRGQLRRNRRHLQLQPQPVSADPSPQDNHPADQPSSVPDRRSPEPPTSPPGKPPPVTQPDTQPVSTRSGRMVKKPARYQ